MALGNGLLQDKIVTPKWFNLANANGFEDGGTNRETIAKEVTPAAIEKAQAMASERKRSGWRIQLT